MPLKKPTGNMYDWITGIWNPVKGECPYGCTYCYANKWGTHRPLRLDDSEFKTDLGHDNIIFICSGCDLFHPTVPDFWIARVCCYAREFQKNQYLLHTKNPARILDLSHRGFSWPGGSIVCVTVESNIPWPGISTAPQPYDRIESLRRIGDKKIITIEPVMDFDVMTFAEMIIDCNPVQVNIGADSGRNRLPEPRSEKIEQLIEYLEAYLPVKIHLKKNLRRLLPKHRLYGGENGKTENYQLHG